MSGLSYFIGNSFGISYEIKSPPGGMRPDAYGIVTAYGSPHLARKAEQVPQGLGDIETSKRTCPLCSITGACPACYCDKIKTILI